MDAKTQSSSFVNNLRIERSRKIASLETKENSGALLEIVGNLGDDVAIDRSKQKRQQRIFATVVRTVPVSRVNKITAGILDKRERNHARALMKSLLELESTAHKREWDRRYSNDSRRRSIESGNVSIAVDAFVFAICAMFVVGYEQCERFRRLLDVIARETTIAFRRIGADSLGALFVSTVYSVKSKYENIANRQRFRASLSVSRNDGLVVSRRRGSTSLLRCAILKPKQYGDRYPTSDDWDHLIELNREFRFVKRNLSVWLTNEREFEEAFGSTRIQNGTIDKDRDNGENTDSLQTRSCKRSKRVEAFCGNDVLGCSTSFAFTPLAK